MALKSDIFGISKLEIGAPGDGVMGSTLKEYGGVREGSATLVIPQSETEGIKSEQNRNVDYRTINIGSDETPMLEGKYLGIKLEDWADLMGGTYDASTKIWKFPTSPVSVYKSVKLTTQITDDATGAYMVFYMPYALITAGISGTVTFNDLTDIDFKFESNIPVSTGGVEGDPFYVQLVDNTYLQTFDVDNGAAQLASAIVAIGGSVLITDAAGQATINLPNGSYAYTVDATGYDQGSGTLVVADAAAQTDVTLSATP